MYSGQNNNEVKKPRNIPLYSAEELREQKEKIMEETIVALKKLDGDEIKKVKAYVDDLRRTQVRWN